MKFKVLWLFSVLFLTVSLAQSAAAQTNDSKAQSTDKTERKAEEKVKDRPFKIIKNSFPRNIGGNCEEGILVRLRVTFHSLAKVTDVEVVSTSGCEYFDRASAKAAMKIKFQPAIKEGEAQTTVKVIEYTFRRI